MPLYKAFDFKDVEQLIKFFQKALQRGYSRANKAKLKGGDDKRAKLDTEQGVELSWVDYLYSSVQI